MTVVAFEVLWAVRVGEDMGEISQNKASFLNASVDNLLAQLSTLSPLFLA